MAQVEVLTANSAPTFDYEFISCSPTLSPPQNKVFTNALVDTILSTTQQHLHAREEHPIEEVHIAGLPAVHYGHPDIHLRKGVMRAVELAADGEPDAEKAFFVADLSVVYQQHLRWQKLLPEIRAFYGKLCSSVTPRTHGLMIS